GIVAAGLSSAASFLSLIGFSAANDVMPYLTGTRVRTPEFATTAASSSMSSGATGGVATGGVATATGGPGEDQTSNSGDNDTRGLRIARWTMVVAGLIVLVITWAAPPAGLTIGYFRATPFAASWRSE